MSHAVTDFLRNHRCKIAAAVSGAGAAAITDIVKEGGASVWLADFRVPYSHKALEQLVCDAVTDRVSQGTAQLMAHSIYRAVFSYDAPYPPEKNFHTLNPDSGVPFGNTFGIGITGNLTCETERLGTKHLVHASAYCPVPVFEGKCYLNTFMIPHGKTRREQEEQVEIFIQQFLIDIAARTT